MPADWSGLEFALANVIIYIVLGDIGEVRVMIVLSGAGGEDFRHGVAEKIFEMFVILLGGVVACKTGLLRTENNQQLSNFLLLLVCPLLIFVSYQIDFDLERLWGLFLALVASLLTFGLCILLSKLLIRRNNPQQS